MFWSLSFLVSIRYSYELVWLSCLVKPPRDGQLTQRRLEILARLIGWCLHHAKSLLNFFRVNAKQAEWKETIKFGTFTSHLLEPLGWDRIWKMLDSAVTYPRTPGQQALPSAPEQSGVVHVVFFFWSIIRPSKSLQLPPQMLCNPLQAQSSWSRELLPEGGCPVWVEGSTELESAF